MIQLVETTPANDIYQRNGEQCDSTLPIRQHVRQAVLTMPNGLVVSSDDEVRPQLAELLRQYGLAPVLASTVAESAMILLGRKVVIVLCQDCLTDGTYDEIVKIASQSYPSTPVVVVSKTGDWPEYLRAMSAGAFDYLAYPTVPGDVEGVIRNALWEREWRQDFAGAGGPHPTCRMEDAAFHY